MQHPNDRRAIEMQTMLKEELAVQVAEVPIEVVRHVLWHLGDQNLGQPADDDGFAESLIRTIEHADADRRLKLSLVFEHYVNAVRAFRLVGVEVLRGRVIAAEAVPLFDVVVLWKIDEELDEHMITGFRSRKLHNGVMTLGPVRGTRAEALEDVLAVLS